MPPAYSMLTAKTILLTLVTCECLRCHHLSQRLAEVDHGESDAVPVLVELLAGAAVLAVDVVLAARAADGAGHRQPLDRRRAARALHRARAPSPGQSAARGHPSAAGEHRGAARDSGRRHPGLGALPRARPLRRALDLSRRPRAWARTLGDHTGSPAHAAARPARPRPLSAGDRARAAVAGH